MNHDNRSRRKPRVTLKCPANVHSGPTERIVEFSHICNTAAGRVLRGGLISFQELDNGRLNIQVYRLDPGIDVMVTVPEGSTARVQRRE